MMQASGIPEVLQQLCPPLLLSLPLVSGQITLFPGQWTDPSRLWADATGILTDSPACFGKSPWSREESPCFLGGSLTDRTTLSMYNAPISGQILLYLGRFPWTLDKSPWYLS